MIMKNIIEFFSDFCAKRRKNKMETMDITKLNGKIIRYVSERIENEATGEVVDTIVARSSVININENNELCLISGIKDIFKCNADDLKAGEFMSLEGVILEGFDLTCGKHRKIIAYYKYYR